MLSKELKDMTYNDLAALSLGEAQALKRKIDELLEEVRKMKGVVSE